MMRPDDRPMYWDRQGNPITDMAWVKLHTPAYKRVAETTIGNIWISTVWLGLDLGFGQGPLLIFETMVFVRHPDEARPEVRAWDEQCWRYATEAEAIVGHDEVCAAIKAIEGSEQ